MLIIDKKYNNESEIRKRLKLVSGCTFAFAGVYKKPAAPSVEFHERWKEHLVTKKAEKIKQGDVVNLCSPTYGDHRVFFNNIQESLENLFEKPNVTKKTSINIFFLNYKHKAFHRVKDKKESNQLFELRFKLWSKANPNITKLPNEWEEQIQSYLDLKADPRFKFLFDKNLLAINVYLFLAWPFSHYAQFNSTIFLGNLLPTDSATKGPMIIAKKPKTPFWRKLAEDNLRVIHEDSDTKALKSLTPLEFYKEKPELRLLPE